MSLKKINVFFSLSSSLSLIYSFSRIVRHPYTHTQTFFISREDDSWEMKNVALMKNLSLVLVLNENISSPSLSVNSVALFHTYFFLLLFFRANSSVRIDNEWRHTRFIENQSYPPSYSWWTTTYRTCDIYRCHIRICLYFCRLNWQSSSYNHHSFREKTSFEYHQYIHCVGKCIALDRFGQKEKKRKFPIDV